MLDLCRWRPQHLADAAARRPLATPFNERRGRQYFIRAFEHLYFEFVSDFDIRISDFLGIWDFTSVRPSLTLRVSEIEVRLRRGFV